MTKITKKNAIIFILSYISFYSCQNNKPIPELIDIAEWDSITIATLKDKIRMDTLQYILVNLEKDVIQMDTVQYTLEYLQYILRFREKKISALLEEKILSDEEVIYIEEIVDYYYNRFLTVMPINKKYLYVFIYDDYADYCSVERRDNFADSFIEPVLYNGIKDGILSELKITTKITKNNKSQLSYEIIRLMVK